MIRTFIPVPFTIEPALAASVRESCRRLPSAPDGDAASRRGLCLDESQADGERGVFALYLVLYRRRVPQLFARHVVIGDVTDYRTGHRSGENRQNDER